MADVRITVGTFAFRARIEREAAPLTCARFDSMLPYREHLIHVGWSGEACWIGGTGCCMQSGDQSSQCLWVVASGASHARQLWRSSENTTPFLVPARPA